MRVALVFPGCFRRGGVERLVWECARHFGQRHSVTVLADVWEECGAPNVSYRRVRPRMRPRFLIPFSFGRRARAALAGGGFDRVVSFGVGCPGDVLWVNSVHRAWLERERELRNGRKRPPLRRFLPHHRALLALEARHFHGRRYRKVIAVSPRVAEDLERLYGVAREHTVTIPNGYAPDEFSPERRLALRPRMRAELGLPPDAVALLMVANELSRKGFAVLLDAVARLDDPRVRILLVGRVAPAPYRERIARLGLEGRLRYVGPTDDPCRYHAAADLFVLPTQYEAFCLAIVEALASGLPVITTDLPGAADAVRPGLNGLLQRDPFDAEELAELLRQALEKPRREAWSAAAARSVQEFQWPSLLARAEVVLEELDQERASVRARPLASRFSERVVR